MEGAGLDTTVPPVSKATTSGVANGASTGRQSLDPARGFAPLRSRRHAPLPRRPRSAARPNRRDVASPRIPTMQRLVHVHSPLFGQNADEIKTKS